MRLRHSDAAVDPLSVSVIGLDVEPESTHIPRLSSTLFYKVIHPTIQPRTTRLRENIHALDPPKPCVPPIAPLAGNHQPADDLFILLGDDIETLILVLEYSRNAWRDLTLIERFTLR